jgi:cold shock CspA family protein
MKNSRPADGKFIKHGHSTMTPRYVGTVTFLDPMTGFGEIDPTGAHAPIPVARTDLRRAGADSVGTVVSFEFGNVPGGNGGAVNVKAETR